MARTEPRLPDDLAESDPKPLENETEWESLAVHGADCSSAIAEDVEIARCLLTGVVFTAAELERLRATDTVFERCEFSGASLHESVLTRVAFRGCRMAGVSLHDSRLRDVLFEDCKLDGANLRMVTAERLEVRDSTITEGDFYGAKLPEAHINRCDLTGAQVTKADVRGTRLHGSTVTDLRGAEHLRGAIIDPDQVLPLALATFAALGITVDEDDG